MSPRRAPILVASGPPFLRSRSRSRSGGGRRGVASIARGLAVAVVAAFIAAGLPSAVQAGPPEATRPSDQAEAGLRAPTCALAALAPAADGFLPPRKRDFAGRLVLVDFWASWCPTCEHAFPFLDALARAHRGRGLEVVAVNLDSDPRDALDFLAGRDVGFEVVHDPSGDCPRAFGLVGMPSSYLIDADGRVVEVTRGFRKGEARALRARIEALLGEAPPAGEGDPALARVAGPPPP